MSQVQLQVRPRRVRCSTSCEPPPFSFRAGATAARERARGAALVAQLPFKAIALAFVAVGRVIDAASFLVGLTIWCALHLTAWSYAFDMGPAAECFGLPCPAWLRAKVIIGCVVLAVVSFLASRLLRRLGHRATSLVLLVLVTFDVSALILLGVGSIT